MNILTCLKNQRSILKIKNNYSDHNFENIREFEELQEKVVFSNWDIAIVDDKIFFDETQTQEAVNLLSKKSVQVILFEGDFEVIFQKLDELLNDSKAEAEKEEPVTEEIDDTPIRYIEKETIKEVIKEVKVIEKEYKHMYSEIENKSIGIMNLSRCAGSTFLTMNLAKAFSKYEILTSIIELPLEPPKIYTNIGIEQKLSEDDDSGYLNFYSFPHEIDINSKMLKDKETYIDDIIFIVPDPHKPQINSETWNYSKMMKLLNVSRKAKINLIDINNSFHHQITRDLLEELDTLIVVIDPNPTEVILNISTLNKIRELEKENITNIKYVLNKVNKGVDLKELKRYIEVEPATRIPYIDISLVYQSLYKGKILYDYEEAREVLNEAFIPLFKELLPIELIKDSITKRDESKTKGFNLLKKFLK